MWKKKILRRTFIQHITKSNSSRVYFVRRAITLVNALRCKSRPRYSEKKPFTSCAKTVRHVASIVTIFQVLQTNWIRAGRDTRIRITIRIARSIWLLHIIPGIGIARQIAEDSDERETKWKRGSKRGREKERVKFERWRAYGTRTKIRERYQRESVGVKLRFVGFDSCEKSREEKPGWKGRRDQFVGIIERRDDASRMKSSRRRHLRDLMS